MSPFVFDGSPQEESLETTLVLLLAMAQPRQDVVLAGPTTPPHNTTALPPLTATQDIHTQYISVGSARDHHDPMQHDTRHEKKLPLREPKFVRVSFCSQKLSSM